MRYFYKEKNGKYKGATTEATPCPKGCGETNSAPHGNEQVFDTDSGSWVTPETDESE